MLVVSYFVHNRVCVPVRVGFTDMDGFSDKVVGG